MATSSKKTTTPRSAGTTPDKWPFAKKVVEATPATKATTKKAAPTPAKKTVAAATKKAAPTPAKKVSAPKTEKPASKQAATSKSAAKKSVKKNTVTPEERYHLIATAAYFLAEQRGFVCCCAKEDWISGEAQIDEMLNA